MGLINFMKNKIRHFIVDTVGSSQPIVINQRVDFFGSCAINRIWYRGDSQELMDLYRQLDVPGEMFWHSVNSAGQDMRRIHTGLPKLIVKVLTNIVINDYDGVEFGDTNASTLSQETWKKIEEKNHLDKIIEKCIKNTLVTGDGAFKISFDRRISDLPIIEFIKGENIDFEYERGNITEVVFTTEYVHSGQKYEFKEHYGYGYIKYELLNSNGKRIPNNSIPQTEWVQSDGVSFDDTVILAVPVLYGENEKYDGRGESIFEGKLDNFDSFDEVWSQWMDALRTNRTKEYIPINLLPVDENTGATLKPNPFDNRFIAIADNMSSANAENKVVRENGVIPHDSYLATYITALDLCLQGIISPSTLGIDTKKLDNSEAQREKEKTTLYTRGNIVEMLNGAIPKLVVSAVCANQIWLKQPVDKPQNVSVKFGEYANPSFESQVETVGKAKAQNIISTETAVDELYGDSRTKEWKKEEVSRIKAEQGIVEVDESGANDDGFQVGF